MKIRNNFVANSSSSSYILIGDSLNRMSDMEQFVKNLDDYNVVNSLWINSTFINQEDFLEDLLEHPHYIDKLFHPFFNNEKNLKLAKSDFFSGFVNTIYALMSNVNVNGQLEWVDSYKNREEFVTLFTPCLIYLLNMYYPNWKNWHYVKYDDHDEPELESGYWANSEKVIRFSHH